MISPMAQSESERPYWFEDEFQTEQERREFEDYMEELYLEARLREFERGEKF